MTDEETPLTGGRTLGSRTITFNLEMIRFFALLGGAALLLTGKFVSVYGVVFPAKSDPSTFWDKLVNGAPSDFDPSQTFIFKLFGFNHTCTLLDFNPSKTVSALIIMLHTMPLCFFVLCHYVRVTSHTNPCFKCLQRFSKIATPIQFLAFTYFYMVFVNSPDGEFNTTEGMNKFKLHYIPYMSWQLGMLLMAVQQCWYIYLKDQIPIKCISKDMLWGYIIFMGILFVVYTYFCWSFINGRPAWDTFSEPGRSLGIIIMYTWDFVAVIVPTFFAFLESRDGNDSEIIFSELQ
jgi:hypothetical protein